MIQSGTVTEVRADRITVRVMRESACAGCKQKKYCDASCASSADRKPITVEVQNTLGAEVGDRVELCSDNRFVLGTTFFIFVFPLILAFVLYGLLSQNHISDTLCLFFSVLLFCVSFIGILFGMNRYVKRHPCVRLKRIIEKTL